MLEHGKAVVCVLCVFWQPDVGGWGEEDWGMDDEDVTES